MSSAESLALATRSSAALTIQGLRVDFPTPRGVAHVLNGVDLSVEPGQVVGLVGESGSGKSVTASTAMGILRPPGKVVGGAIRFFGRSLQNLSAEELRSLRGSQLTMVVQNARAAFNPLLTIGRQLRTIYRANLDLDRGQADAHAREMLISVAFPDPDRILASYPHQLSGGMLQRVQLAAALGTSAKLVLADEPTTGLDPTIQVEILDLFISMIRSSQTATLLITHDLGIVASYCDVVAVMHAGVVVENAPVEAFFARPSHPYSAGLLNGVRGVEDALAVEGSPPDLTHLPSGCTYRTRCPLAIDVCAQIDPPLAPIETRARHAASHDVKCHRWRDVRSLEGHG